MASEWIDVSVPLRNGMTGWPGDQPFERTLTHSIAGGASNNLSQFVTSAHAGTHMDAPFHFFDDAATIDSVDLERCVGEALLVRLSVSSRETITRAHLVEHRDDLVRLGKIVISTGWAAHWGRSF